MVGFILRIMAVLFLGSLYKELLKPDLIKDLFISQSGYVKRLRGSLTKAENEIEQTKRETGVMVAVEFQTIRTVVASIHVGVFAISLIVVPNNLYKCLAAVFLVTTAIEHVMMSHLYQGRETKMEMSLDRAFNFLNYIGYPIIILGLIFLH